ncbi:MAG: NAD(P)-dependent oxidoreductase [Gammaproteobacteria bacterium]|jgi:3-hydroxyisobutyrate dehydrogenase
MSQTITVFGFGPLGEAIARRLLAGNYQVNIWNRSPERLLSLAEAGAIVKASASQAIKSADTIVCALPDAVAIQEVLFDVDWAHELHGRMVINFSSVNPSRSQALMDAFQAHQARYVEVAALGSVADLANGHLQLLVGAEPDDFAPVASLLNDISSRVTVLEDVGKAVAIKQALQQMSATLFCAFAASVGLIREQGVEVDQFMDFLRASAMYTPLFDQKLPRMLSRDYSNASLPAKHLERELKLFLEEAEDLGINAHHVQSIRDLLSLCVARGMQDLDFTAVYDVLSPPGEEDI